MGSSSRRGPLGGGAFFPAIDTGTMCRAASPLPGPLGAPRPTRPRGDEVTPIASYIAGEMNANAHGEDARRMREMNGFSITQCITDFQQLPWWKQLLGLGITPDDCLNVGMSYKVAALLRWSLLVRQDGPWDHKPYIRKNFHPVVPGGEQHWHHRGGVLYYYDIWSNIHYGYVGAACGFSESELLDGAGLEQIGSDLWRRKWPSGSEGVEGVRRYDDPSDREAITIGIRLHGAAPNRVTAAQVLQEVEASRSLYKKPYSP